jgi:small conductance mechanosensitive channel
MFWQWLFADPITWQPVVLAVLPTAVLAFAAARLARRAMQRLLQGVLRDTIVPSSPLVRTPLRLIAITIFGIVFGALIFPAFEIVGLKPRAGMPLQTLSAWTFDSGLKIVLIGAVAYAVLRIVTVAVSRFEHDVNFGTDLDALERAKRARTLGSVLTNVTTVLVLAVASLMILHEFKIDISPALTGAGIVGVALGFGAQTLVRDIIGGFFLILENQVRVGDSASINGIGGLVEEINLRTTVLRDEEGTLHIVPNGAITTLANRSMNFSYYVLNLPLAYDQKPDVVIDLLKTTAATLAAEDAYRPFVLEPLEIIGVDAFEEHAFRLKARIKTAPQRQWFVGRELRKRLLEAMAARGIAMWSPARTVDLGRLSTQPGSTPRASGPSTPARS